MPDPRPTDRETDGHLRVTLSVTPSSAADCVVLGSGSSGTVSMHTTPESGDCDGGCRAQCRAEATADSDAEPKLLTGEVADRCICPAFREYDCVASIDGFEGDTLSVSVVVPDREELVAVVAALRARDATVRVDRLSTSPGGDSDGRSLELAADTVTGKQREAVRTAVSAGYYETPRDADLADLAAELGVSRSAISQRLAAVESKLVAELARADGPVAAD
ncbi:HTH-10 family transcription regulator [Natronomonas moolapensis 8.8.11]|uniref:HTH-10 family transcription regulator n=1 Tax=Natronomonas moolapensis (strain DSM 18674 / CECT 7526 / JCM 14361 / 8.8.11) TaxID=268739 RepID=M1XTL8_NATM8|nr:helix-turn-helix domain-containing protein [Natronomonas moolapensis]CCQ37862.1 HTH-10 family transcription regulator [Natronomonas moolapensis 8.8.11]